MAFIDTIGLGAAALFGIGTAGRGLRLAPKIFSGKMLSKVASFSARKGAAAAWGASKMTAKMTPWAVKGAGSLAFKFGNFALRHPYVTAGAIGAGYYLTTEGSPYLSPSMSGKLEGVRLSSKFNEEQMAADALNESGVAPMGGIVSGAAVRNQRLMQSTFGLTQGLHRMRH